MPAPRILGRKYKQPGETADFYVDWSEWFAGDPANGLPARLDSPITVATPDFPAGVTLEDLALVGYAAKLVISGGTSGVRHKITVRMTTDASPPIIDEAEFELYILEA